MPLRLASYKDDVCQAKNNVREVAEQVVEVVELVHRVGTSEILFVKSFKVQ